MSVDTQIAAAMEQLTAARTAQMVDSCTAVRPSDKPQTPVLDANGNVTTPAGVPVYSGRCTFSDPGRPATGVQTTTEESGVPNIRILKVPHSADLRPGDLVICDSSEFSPGLVNDEFTVLGEEERSYATYRRYRVRGSSWLPTDSGA